MSRSGRGAARSERGVSGGAQGQKGSKSRGDLQGNAAFGRSEYAEQGKTPQFRDSALPLFGRECAPFSLFGLPVNFVQAAFATPAEIGGARRAPQNAQRSAAAAAKPLLFHCGEAAMKGAPRPLGSFCRPAPRAGNLHFPCGCGVAAEWEKQRRN